MPNEEIITGLRNAVEHGESLHEAMQIMINSGYNPAEVQEASRFVGGGILESHIPKPEENLMFPEKKSFFSDFSSKLKFWKKDKNNQIKQQSGSQEINQIKRAISPNIYSAPVNNFSRELQNITPKKSYTKEIILVVILLVLVGVLITTILLKDTILGWFA